MAVRRPTKGLGFVIYRGTQEITSDSIRLLEHCTVYQAKVMAIHLPAQETAHVLTNSDDYIKLFSGSQAALKSIKNYLASKLVAKGCSRFTE